MWARSQAQGHGAGLWSWRLLPCSLPRPCRGSFFLVGIGRSTLKGESAEWITVEEQGSLSNTVFVHAGRGPAGWDVGAVTPPSLREGRQREGWLLGTHLGCQLLSPDMCIILSYSHWPGVSRLGEAHSGRAPFMGTPSSTLGCRRARMAAVKSHASCKQPPTTPHSLSKPSELIGSPGCDLW